MTEMLVKGEKVVINGKKIYCDNAELVKKLEFAATPISMLDQEYIIVVTAQNEFDGIITGGLYDQDWVRNNERDPNEPLDLIY